MFENLILDVLLDVFSVVNINVNRDLILSNLSVPPKSDMGDFAFPCFVLSKSVGKSPIEISKLICENVDLSKFEFLKDVKSFGPYVNFFVDSGLFVKDVFKLNFLKKKSLLSKTVCFDYSAPNIAKPFSIGHLRSTVIGGSLKNIFSHLGWKTVGINYLGDWGTQFGKLILAYKKYGEPEFSENPIKDLLKLYVQIHKDIDHDPSLADEARAWFKRLEEGDAEAVTLWKRFKELSLKEFQKLYDELGVSFDSYRGESYYSDKMSDTISLLKDKGLLIESDGALIVDLEKYGMPPCLIQKKDGATLYATRDITAAIDRYNTYKFDLMLYDVGSEQSLHFKQFFKVLELAGFEWSKYLVHVAHGLYRFKDFKMSTRKGNVILMEDLFDKATEIVSKIIEEKNPSLVNKSVVARQVAIGAIIFNDLKNDRVKDIVFDWDNILNFEGETGPYVQYTNARIHSILRKSGFDSFDFEVDYSLLTNVKEIEISKELLRFDYVLNQVISHYKPHILAKYLIGLCQSFNSYYANVNILKVDDPKLKFARVSFINIVSKTIEKGLDLMGIKHPEEM